MAQPSGKMVQYNRRDGSKIPCRVLKVNDIYRRLAIYTEKIQETVLNKSAETIRSLVDERHNQKMTQQEISDITRIKPSNLARFESGGRVPTCILRLNRVLPQLSVLSV